MKKWIFLLLFFPLMATAQRVGVYESWEQSPFRLGKMQGEATVSDSVITFVRSRMGSNTYGVRVWLDSPLKTSPKPVQVSLKMLKPKSGRTLLIGLGKRDNRPGQSEETEQFWVLSDSTVAPGHWTDATFNVRTAPGVSVYSIVVVPDMESPHELEKDFKVYIKDLRIVQ